MKILHGLFASIISVLPAISAGAADLLPAMTSAYDGGAVINSPTASGYAERGRLMIADGNYRGAADQLRRSLTLNPLSASGDAQREAAEYWLAVACSHIPGEDATGLFSSFIEKYPASPYRERALLGMAGTLLDRKDYVAAYEIYRSIDRDALNPSDDDERTLGEAFCLLKFARYKDAKVLLTQLLPTARGNEARFYLAYSDYVIGRYKDALTRFSRVNYAGPAPVNATPYYVAQLYYLLGEYDQAKEVSSRLLIGDCLEEYKPETNRVLGESLHELGKRAEAIPYLKKYYDAVENPRPSAAYILGVDAYNKGDFRGAVEKLQPVLSENNAMGQSAYLYLGQSYIQLGNNDAALLALDHAVKNDYDSKVTELASYNYAVATANGGKLPFGSSVALFESFLRNYPDSELAPAVADYIINGYISDNNYGAALRAINNIDKPSDKILAAKQKVLYMHGTRQLQAGRQDEAITYLAEARSLGRFSAELASESTLWLGEAQYRKGNYAEAVKNYDKFLRETPSSNPNHSLALYDMAYARFALKEFSKAKEYFNRYVSSLKKGKTPADVISLKADAYNRLGDCAYYGADFTGAALEYNKAIDAAPSAADYPMFQTAIMKGLTRDHKGKIEGLAAMMKRFPSSALIPSALLETGESYTELGDVNNAISTYLTLSERYPSTTQGRQGALLLAISRLNDGETDLAIKAYKHVISTYPTSEEARAAAEDLKHIYADRGEIGEYTRFLATVPDAPKLEQGEIVVLQLQGVEKAYEEQRNKDAARLARELLDAYPDAPQAVGALAILADVKEKEGKPAEALDAYRKLAEKASNEIDVNKARMGILRLSRDLGSDEAVLETASQLLESSSLGNDDRYEVMLAKALALRNTGEDESANEILKSLAVNPEIIQGAKASYYLAQGYFDKGETDAALHQVNDLIDSNTPQEYWLARGFILLSDIKRVKGETFEADEYLKSLRDNYPGNEPDIYQMIETRLSK